ncbi:FtsW/RodA/SpoVE family cell cycle protein [Trueperella sp. LYQ143]|uniref:FtsW/RodA/SpoVE family cell cycle protein n=1 Tax=unclassified Trueperella TaxID=2630174 RepID=UPI0039830076
MTQVGAAREDTERARRDKVQQALVVMLLSTLVLTLLGVLMVFSATAPASIGLVDADPTQRLFSIAIRQMIWSVAGIFFGIILAMIPYTFTRRYAHLFLALGCLLQAGVLLQGGEGANGNNNWLHLGPVVIQPSEFLKLAMIVWLAHMLARLQLEEIKNLRTLVIPGLGFTIAVGLVAAGQDMGTAIIYALIAIGMFWLAGMRGWHMLSLLFVAGVATGVLLLSKPSRIRRVGEFISGLFTLPDIDSPTQTDYAQFAFGSGGLTGVGIGAGKEKWRDLSEAHTDFIYAVIGEELGLFGVVTVIVLFLALGWALIRIAMYHQDRYAQLLAIGALLWLCGQALSNMCVVTGLLPVFGVPLPFVSMGGSSMIATLMMVGCVSACALGVPGVKDSWRVRGRLAQGVRTLVRRKQS